MKSNCKERWFASNSDYIPQKSDQVVIAPFGLIESEF
jgi:hypothetical protein